MAIQVLLLPLSANLTIAAEDFMPRIQLQTGDITHQPFKLREFVLEARRPLSQIVLAFDGHEACIRASQWPSLLEQVKMRSLSRWKHSRIPPPMGQPEMQELLSAVENTSAYQLFLAGFDLAETLASAALSLAVSRTSRLASCRPRSKAALRASGEETRSSP